MLLKNIWLIPTITLLGLGAGSHEAIAQTTYPFEATFNSEITNRPLSGNVFETSATSESADAPYGLTNVRSENYSSVDPDTGVITSDTDPATYNLEGFPVGSATLFGDGSDRVFGTLRSTVSGDTVSGTITLTGGEGRFIGATGTLNLSQTITSSPDRTGVNAPIESPATISGSFQTVPEPSTNATLIGISMIGVGLLLRRRTSGSADRSSN